MADQSSAHETLAWAKQRLDDLDTMISVAEKSADNLKENAQKEADHALARLRQSRVKVMKHYDDLRAEADAVKRGAGEIQDALEAEWVEVESVFHSFLSIARDQAQTTRQLIASRAKAQRHSWEASMKDLRDQATETVERASGEFDAAIKRLSDRAEKFQSRIGEAKDAGDESWKAVKSGLAEAKAVHDRTIQKIKDAYSKLL